MIFDMKYLRVSYLKISPEYPMEAVGFQLGKRSCERKATLKIASCNIIFFSY